MFSAQVFSQIDTSVSGKIISQELLLKNIEVVNFNNKKIAVTNDFGEFKIAAKENDKLIILTDKYVDKSVVITKKDLTEILIINLTEKPIELEEVKVVTKPKFSVNDSYNDIKMAKIEKAQSRPQPTGVYTGEIVNGADFIQIGKILIEQIGKIFKSNKPKKNKNLNTINFKEYSQSNFSKDFYTKKLEINSDQVALFIDYCEGDPKSKDVVNTENEFTILDFLITKKAEFLKVQAEEKK